MSTGNPQNLWEEDTSKRYLVYGRYFVPEREEQMRIMVNLLKGISEPHQVLELCCGEGLLAEMVLEQLPQATYLGLDGSPLMLEQAGKKLSRFGNRVKLDSFNLASQSWRRLEEPVQAVVSALAIHHLDGEGKRLLFKDVYEMLVQGGAFIVADMVEPVKDAGRLVAADAWDQVVRKRSLELDGSAAGFDFFLREGWNTYRYRDPDDIDHPSSLLDQLKWLEEAGFTSIDVHFMQAGHALFSGWK